MAERRVELEGLSVVVKGAFNPAMVTPDWLVERELMAAPLRGPLPTPTLTPDVCTFDFEWLRMVITQDAVQAETTQVEDFERVRDVVVGVLRAYDALPVSALGINRNLHVKLQSPDELHSIGDAVAPKTLWEDILPHAGLRSATMWGLRDDRQEGRVQVIVEPSVRVENGLYLGINDHYSLRERAGDALPDRDAAFTPAPDDVDGSAAKNSAARVVLASCFAQSIERGDGILKRLVSISSPGGVRV